MNWYNHWFCFSAFIPEFLERIANEIDSPEVKGRILEIVCEEKGKDLSHSHSELFKQAMELHGYKIELINSRAIKHLISEFENSINYFDRESFSIGVSFGLEIIAEENIDYLLSNTSESSFHYKKNRESLFFKIHLVNEAEHIAKCIENIQVVSQENKESLKAGIKLSLLFWKSFWEEALDV